MRKLTKKEQKTTYFSSSSLIWRWVPPSAFPAEIHRVPWPYSHLLACPAGPQGVRGSQAIWETCSLQCVLGLSHGLLPNHRSIRQMPNKKIMHVLVLKSFWASSSWKIYQSIYQLLFHTASGLSTLIDIEILPPLIVSDLKSHFPTSVRSPVKQSTNTEARTLK